MFVFESTDDEVVPKDGHCTSRLNPSIEEPPLRAGIVEWKAEILMLHTVKAWQALKNYKKSD